MQTEATLSATPRANRTRRPDALTSSPSEAQSPTTRKRPRSARLGALVRVLRELMSVASVVALLGAFVLGAREARQWMVSTDRFRAREITVTGLGRTRETEVLHVAHLSSERNVLSIDCERAARQIESLPWVAHAHVTRHLPGTVAVSVEERTAVATVSADHVYLVSSDGTLFKRAAPGDPADLPVITGIPRADFERDPTGAREGVRDVLALLSDVEASAVGAPLRVDEVHRELTGDLSIVLEGTHVWLGRGPYRAKLTRLRVVIRELHRRGLRGSEIHLESDRHPERVTVRLADRAAP